MTTKYEIVGTGNPLPTEPFAATDDEAEALHFLAAAERLGPASIRGYTKADLREIIRRKRLR